jgi:hypothetical protein
MLLAALSYKMSVTKLWKLLHGHGVQAAAVQHKVINYSAPCRQNRPLYIMLFCNTEILQQVSGTFANLTSETDVNFVCRLVNIRNIM